LGGGESGSWKHGTRPSSRKKGKRTDLDEGKNFLGMWRMDTPRRTKGSLVQSRTRKLSAIELGEGQRRLVPRYGKNGKRV